MGTQVMTTAASVGIRLCLAILTAIFCSLTVLAVPTNHYYVKADNTTPSPPYRTWSDAATNIQTAVTQAETDWNADTNFIVWVTNGTYSLTNSIVISKEITVRSVNGRDTTFVNGNYPGYTNRCFTITGYGILDGFTVTNGYAIGAVPGYGGGIYLATGSVIHCTIRWNHAYDTVATFGYGAGVYAYGPSIVSNCIVANNGNLSMKAQGAGIYLKAGALATHCQVYSNEASGISPSVGGGICADGGIVRSTWIFNGNHARHNGGFSIGNGSLMDNCVISNNIAGNGAGGALGSSSYISNTLFTCNVGANGAGLNNTYGTIVNCRFLYNVSSGSGGGVQMDRGIIRNCLMAGNKAGIGGGLYVGSSGAKSTIENCTIVRNSANVGGGLSNLGGGHVRNCIVYSNSAPIFPDFQQTNALSTVTDIYVQNNCTTTNLNDLITATNSPGNIIVSGNITADPKFSDPGWGYGTNAVLGNYFLFKESPCEDTGTNLAWMTTSLANDLAGYPRILPIEGIVNMGAYEYTLVRPGGIFTIL